MKRIIALLALCTLGITLQAVICPATKQKFATMEECKKKCSTDCQAEFDIAIAPNFGGVCIGSGYLCKQA